MNRNIDLIRYRKFEGDLLLLEQLTSTSAATPTSLDASSGSSRPSTRGKGKTIGQQIEEAPQKVRELYDALDAYLTALGDDVSVKMTDFYVGYRRIKNFACVEVRNQLGRVLLFVKVNPDTVNLEEGFTRDVRKVGHFGTGDLEITISSMADLDRAKPLLDRSYNES